MKELKEAIMKWGTVPCDGVVKVDNFLNHRIDSGLMMRMGKELADAFRMQSPDLVLTVEASGIALALAAAVALGEIPVVFAKKGATLVQNDDVAETRIFSFTRQQEVAIRVEKDYLPEGSRVLIVDDFLADGNAVRGMMALCRQQKCEVCGIGIAVEKGFQKGGRYLREQGLKVVSLAIIDDISGGKVTIR